MPRHVHHGDVALALTHLVREGVITSFKTNFVDRNEPSWMPEIRAALPPAADLASALARVEGAVMPLGVVQVTLESNPQPSLERSV